MSDPEATGSKAVNSQVQRLAISERIAAGEQIDAAELPAELLAQPAIQRLLQLSRVMQQLGENQQADNPTDTTKHRARVDNFSGDNFGAYRLLRLLGAGGMGEVWLAERTDGLVEHQVAIKRVHGHATRLMDRLLSERKLLARLSHPGIARFIDAGVDAADAPWLAMEYVDGVTITQWCSERNLSLQDRLELFSKVCAAVAHAHRHLIVHRDIKPNNVLVDRDGQPKLLDFGIAKLLDGVSGEFTVNAMTPAYAAPEQLRAEEVSTATDVYALGLLLFRLLAGALPKTRSIENIPAILMRVHLEENERPSERLQEILKLRSGTTTGEKLRNETKLMTNTALAARRAAGAQAAQSALAEQDFHIAPRPAAQTNSSLSYPSAALKGDLDAIVAQALRLAPEDRYGSVAEFSSDIGRYLHAQPVRARPASRWYRLSRFTKRNRMAVAFAGVAFIALGSAALVSIYQAQIAAAAAKRADLEAASAGRVSDFALDMFRELSATGRNSTAPRSPKQVLEGAIKEARASLADDPIALAKVLNKLGEIQMSADSPAAAEPAVAQALRLYREILGNENPETALAMVSFATVRKQLGDLEAAEQLLNEALAIFAPLPDWQRAWVMTQSRLANICRATGRTLAAFSHIDAALSIAQTAYGPDHPNTIELEVNRAMLLVSLDRLPQARSAFESAIAAYQRTQGPDFPRLVWPMASLSGVLAKQGDYTLASTTLQQALNLGKRVLGADNYYLQFFTIDYADLLTKTGELTRARATLASIAIADLREAPEDLQSYYTALGTLALAQGHLDGAAQAFALAGEWSQKNIGTRGAAAIWLDCQRAKLFVAQKNWAAAQAILEQVDADLARMPELSIYTRVAVAELRVRLLAHAGQLGHASTELQNAIALVTAVSGENTLDVMRLQALQVQLLRSGGRTQALQAHSLASSIRAKLAALHLQPAWLDELDE